MYMVKEIMASPVLTINPEKSVFQAAEHMKEHRIGGLPVVDGNGLAGIITSRDIRQNHPNRIVADSMTKTVIFCSPLNTTVDASELMEKHKIERLPVMEKGELVGMLTKSQIMKYIGQLYDPLTGIYNSSYIYMLATKFFSEEHEISVILFDINSFGEFNKKWGHVYGDKCLKEVARILLECTANKYEYLCRYGGDEFVVITLKKSKDAEILANRVIDKIASETLKTGMPVTISAGISGGHRKFARIANNQHRVVEDLINKASLASTRAKELKQKYLVG